MKLYHIDRFGALSEGQVLNLQKNIYFEDIYMQKCLETVILDYKDGLSHHGLNYLLTNNLSNNDVMPLSNVIDIVFEYERMINYTNKLSRYQSFYAFDCEGVKEFIKDKNLNKSFFKIYEVESDYYEKHNMTLLSGYSHYNIAAMAKCYWGDKDDPFERPILNEYLLKYPVKIVREIKLEEIGEN